VKVEGLSLYYLVIRVRGGGWRVDGSGFGVYVVGD